MSQCSGRPDVVAWLVSYLSVIFLLVVCGVHYDAGWGPRSGISHYFSFSLSIFGRGSFQQGRWLIGSHAN